MKDFTTDPVLYRDPGSGREILPQLMSDPVLSVSSVASRYMIVTWEEPTTNTEEYRVAFQFGGIYGDTDAEARAGLVRFCKVNAMQTGTELPRLAPALFQGYLDDAVEFVHDRKGPDLSGWDPIDLGISIGADMDKLVLLLRRKPQTPVTN